MSSVVPANTLLCLGTILLLPLILIAVVAVRYLRYRERIALAEKGLPYPEPDGKDTLRWGILITALGLAICIGVYPVGASSNIQYPFGFGPWMLLGLVPLFFGLALILIYLLAGEKPKS